MEEGFGLKGEPSSDNTSAGKISSNHLCYLVCLTHGRLCASSGDGAFVECAMLGGLQEGALRATVYNIEEHKFFNSSRRTKLTNFFKGIIKGKSNYLCKSPLTSK